MHRLQPPARLQARLQARLFTIALALTLASLLTSCVVKENLSDVYNQARLGLNQWSLTAGGREETLKFDLGYLIGLVDKNTIDAVSWRYELMTPRRELLARHEEEMRPPDATKTQVFVQGRRLRELAVPRPLTEGQRVVLWFTLLYRGEVLHEQLFGLDAGREGGDPNWINEWIDSSGVELGGELAPPASGEVGFTTDLGQDTIPMMAGAAAQGGS